MLRSQHRCKPSLQLRCGNQKAAEKKNKTRILRGSCPLNYLCENTPESPWDIIIFLPSLSWIRFGWGFVRWSESKRFSVFISHVLTDYMSVLGSKRSVDIHFTSVYMGWVAEAAFCGNIVNLTPHWSCDSEILKGCYRYMASWLTKLCVYFCRPLYPFVRMLLVQDVERPHY